MKKWIILALLLTVLATVQLAAVITIRLRVFDRALGEVPVISGYFVRGITTYDSFEGTMTQVGTDSQGYRIFQYQVPYPSHNPRYIQAKAYYKGHRASGSLWQPYLIDGALFELTPSIYINPDILPPQY